MKSRILICVTTMTVLTALAIPVRLAAQEAPTYTVLSTFTGGADGAGPEASVPRRVCFWTGPATFYGTTFSGGASGNGVVFKLDRTGKETVLYTFTGGTDGRQSYAGLVRDEEGNLYDTTGGGDLSCPTGFGCGVVFKLDPTGKETAPPTTPGAVLHVTEGRLRHLLCHYF